MQSEGSEYAAHNGKNKLRSIILKRITKCIFLNPDIMHGPILSAYCFLFSKMTPILIFASTPIFA